MKKIGLLVGLVLIGSSVAFNFIEKEKDRLINEKIADVKENYKVEVQFKDSSYSYLDDKLQLNNVTMQGYGIKSIIINNGRSNPDYIDIEVEELKIPTEHIKNLVSDMQKTEKLKSLINHISKNEEFFTINGSVLDLVDKSGETISTEILVDMENVAKITSKIKVNNIPVEVFKVENLKTWFLKMDEKKMEKLSKLSVLPSYLKIETQGLMISVREYLIKEEMKTNEELINQLDFGIDKIKKNKSLPKIISSNVFNAIESLREGKEYFIKLNLEKELNLDKISKEKIVFKRSTEKEIKEALGISLTSKSL